MIVAAGPGVRPFEQPPLLVDLVGSDAKVTKSEPAVQIPCMPTGEESSSVSDTEADEMEEHLRGLGYLE